MVGIAIKLSGKQGAVAGILVAELLVLGLVAWLGSSAPSDGIAVRSDQAGLRVTDQSSVTATISVDWVVARGRSPARRRVNADRVC